MNSVVFGSNTLTTKFTWADQIYNDFMMQMLAMLEPRKEFKHTVLFEEDEEISEIFFVSAGQVVVGYEVMSQKKYCIRYTDYCILGAFEVNFSIKSSFIYTALTNIEGHSIRKSNWHILMNDNPEIVANMKKNTLFYYLSNIR